MGLQFAGRARRQRRLHVGTQARVPPPRRQLPRQDGAVRRSATSSPHLAPRLREGSVVRGGHERQDHGDEPAGRRARGRRDRRVVCNRTGREPGLRRGHVAAARRSGADWGVFETRRAVAGEGSCRTSAGHLRGAAQPVPRPAGPGAARSTASRKASSGALENARRTPRSCTTPTTRCAPPSPSAWATPPSTFGVSEDMGLPQNSVADAQMCQRCSVHVGVRVPPVRPTGSVPLSSHAGSRGPRWTTRHPRRASAASDGLSFALQVTRTAQGDKARDLPDARFVRRRVHGVQPAGNRRRGRSRWAARRRRCSVPSTRSTRKTAACKRSTSRGRRVLLNLAKNPTGFNQNLKIIAARREPKAVAFFVNDKEGDGRDVSWLWDIDFEEAGRSGRRGVRRADCAGTTCRCA